ncbi:hypothetical protein BH10BAC5_BH10BAC5_19840 [soil metagenome]
MAKTKQQNLANLKAKKQKTDHLHIALTTKNYMIIGFGILVILIGYVLMSPNSVDGFLPTIVAPIFLVIGYCVIIPIGILYKDNKVKEDVIAEVNSPIAKTSQQVTSNVRTS